MSIVRMKRLRMVGMISDREELLQLFQHMGCVEIDEPKKKLVDPEWAALAQPDGQALSQAREAYLSAQTALNILKKRAKPKGGLLTPRPVIREEQLFDNAAYHASLKMAGEILELERQISTLYAEQSKLRSQKLSLVPWLPLDVPLESASTPDVVVAFGTVGVRAPMEEVQGKLRAATELAELKPAGADGELQYLLLVCHKSVEETVMDVLREYGFSRAGLRGLTGTATENDRQIDARLAELALETEATIAKLVTYAEHNLSLQLCEERAKVEVSREEARCRLLDTELTFFLEGWLPEADVPALEQKLSTYPCAWETETPRKEDYPEVPIKIKSNVLTEPLNTITEMYSLPAYDGVDANPLIAPFYIFFFGFMFADLGYGIILAGACLFLQLRVKPKGGFGQLIRLMLMCGIASAVIGFFTGGFFSDFLTRFSGILGVDTPQIPFLTVDPLLDVMNEPMTVLIFALVVGFIQIIVGMIVKFYMLCRERKFADAIWDIGTWWVIFAGIILFALKIGNIGSVPVVLVIGILMLLSQGRNGKGFGRVTAVIGGIYNGVTGYFGDILSYARLMVMLLASTVIGQVFNILGTMPGDGVPKPVAIIIFFVIFIIGHAFNFGLNVIGTYVHTSRLQYLEFFKQFYKEGGRKFRPLTVETTYVDVIKEEK